MALRTLLRDFRIGRPQRVAALLLLVFFAECLFVIGHQSLSPQDFRYARCGREMWERPSPLAGYFTTCGNLNGDGTFAYRVAGLPLTLQRFVLLGADKLRRPENRLYNGSSLNGSTWEARHELTEVVYLLHLPFVFFAIWLGGGVWWVARRLFGDRGAAFALALYVFNPVVLAFSVRPNNEVLAMWGLYGLVYTAIGVAHAMQGPRRKWRPRILLLTLALGLTAAAHLIAAILGYLVAAVLMMYLAERRRSYVIQVLVFSIFGALAILFASYAFRLAPFSYVFTGGGARFSISLDPVRTLLHNPALSPTLVALLVALLLWIGTRRSRYFGNSVPLAVALVLLPVVSTQIVTVANLWAMPFLVTFLGGVFADAFETRYRRMFLALAVVIVLAQAISSIAGLRLLARA